VFDDPAKFISKEEESIIEFVKDDEEVPDLFM